MQNNDYSNIKIFVTNGVGRSGKDTFAQFIDELIEEQTERRQGFNKLSSVDVAKDLAEHHGVDRNDKSDKARKFHSDLLRALEAYDNSPLQSVVDEIEDLYQYEQQRYFAVDIREPYRIDKFKAMCMTQLPNAKVRTVYIDRPSVAEIKSNEGDASTYEPYDYDYTCYNEKDLDTWKKTARDFAEYFVLGKV